MKQVDENKEIKKEINIFFDENGDDLQSIIDNLLLEIYKEKTMYNCNMIPFGV